MIVKIFSVSLTKLLKELWPNLQKGSLKGLLPMQKKVLITHVRHMCDYNFIRNMIHILNQTFSQECDQKLDDVI